MGINNKLENPYQLKSKADMMMDCCEDSAKKAALAVLYKDSCSCAKRSHKNRGSEGGIRMVNLFFIVVSACLVSTDVLLWMLWAGERRNQLV